MCSQREHFINFILLFHKTTMTFMGGREIHPTNYIFLRRLNYPSLISSPPPPPKLKHKLHNSNKLTENNTQPPNKLLQKFSLKKNPLTKITTHTNFRCY